MPELKAKDILQEFAKRRVAGHRTERRVGGRAWAAPRFAKGRRIFERLGMPDPWDPDAPKDTDIALGDVALPTHREPKPHLMPKETAKPGAPKLPNIPGMPAPMPRESTGKPAPRIGETRVDDTAALKAKSKEKERQAAEELRRARMDAAAATATTGSPPVARLPVRPDLEGALAAKGKAPTPPGPARPTGGSAAPAPTPPPRPPTPSGTAPSAAAPPRPTAPRPGPRSPTSRVNLEPVRRPVETFDAVEVEELPPPPPSDWRRAGDVADLFGTGGGGWEVRKFEAAEELPTPEAPRLETPANPEPRPEIREPEVRRTETEVHPESEIRRAPEPEVRRPPEPPRMPEPEPRRPEVRNPEIGGRNPEIGARPTPPPSRKPSSGGLDDLFGMGGETRVRIPKPAEGETRPRRPMVSTPDQMADQKIDRRPPPPKPPVVKPTSGGGMKDPEAED